MRVERRRFSPGAVDYDGSLPARQICEDLPGPTAMISD
jgi:hypothetical protein